MLYDGVALHNVAGLTDRDAGVRLDRLPGDVRRGLNENARTMYARPAGSEIRAVSDGPVEVTVSCPDGRCTATPGYGSFLAAPDDRVAVGPEPTTVELAVPDRLRELDHGRVDGTAFSPDVVRLLLGDGGPVVLHGVAGDVRPPDDAELPDWRYLAYGTSITQGEAASGPHLTYAGQAARRLGADLLNLGTSGSALCEAGIADHVADRDDWDVATLAVSVNMIAAGFAADEFRERAAYMVDAVAGANPGKPVACVTLYPAFPDLCPGLDGENWATDTETYRDVLREVVAASPHDNAHLIEGPDLLTDATGLAPDLLHPTDHGMIEVGERLAPRLAALLGQEG